MMGNDYELPVVQKNLDNKVPTAHVFVESSPRPLTPVQAKRARFVLNLKNNYQRLKETLAFFEHFARVCELSPHGIEAIKKANEDALQELSQKFEAKIKAYDQRISLAGSPHSSESRGGP